MNKDQDMQIANALQDSCNVLTPINLHSKRLSTAKKRANSQELENLDPNENSAMTPVNEKPNAARKLNLNQAPTTSRQIRRPRQNARVEADNGVYSDLGFLQMDIGNERQTGNLDTNRQISNDSNQESQQQPQSTSTARTTTRSNPNNGPRITEGGAIIAVRLINFMSHSQGSKLYFYSQI